MNKMSETQINHNANISNEKTPLLTDAQSSHRSVNQEILPECDQPDSSHNYRNNQNQSDADKEEKQRWLSIRIMYMTCFLSSVAFGISMSSIWPFLSKLDETADTSFLGWIVAAFSLGQFISSPLFGWWANKRGISREPLLVSMTIFTLCCLMYTYLEDFPSQRKYWMLISRFLIGFGAGNISVVRSYVAGATTLKERTAVMANLSTFQAVGFIVGPGFQTACVPLGYPGPVETIYFRLNMYTLPVLIAAVSAVINMLLIIFVFKECRKDDHAHVSDITTNVKDVPTAIEEDLPTSINSAYSGTTNQALHDNASTISDKRDRVNSNCGSEPVQYDFSPDLIASGACILVFFVVLFVFSLFETILTPLTMHEIGWSQSQATLYVGVLLMGGAVLSVADFTVVKFLAKKYDERKLLILSMLVFVLGFVTYLPWGSELPPLQAPILNGNSTVQLSNSTSGGCPSDYDWCYTTPKIYLWQIILSNGIITIGYPGCNVLVYGLYSKVLGPKPQGTMMGIISASGSLARMLGPIFVSHMYQSFGPRWTFVATTAFILLTVVVFGGLYARVVSYYDYVKKCKSLSSAHHT